jgi:hypothetical protein
MTAVFNIIGIIVLVTALAMSVTNAVYIRKYPSRVVMWRWVIDQMYLMLIVVFTLLALWKKG